MNKSELIAALAAKTNDHKAAAEGHLVALGQVIREELAKGGELTLPGVGKLSVVVRSAREGRNPHTGDAMQIPAKRVAKLTANKDLKDALS